MKHLFIFNPASGSSRAPGLIRDIRSLWESAGEEYEIYETTGPGDGEEYVRKRCLEVAQAASAHMSTVREDTPPHPDDPDEKKESIGLRIYACGGDGTLNEVVNGARGFSFVEIGCVPLGTGNDFVRNFPDTDFTDMLSQLRGDCVPCDLIEYTSVLDGKAIHRYCINMFNIGFDCNVVDMTDRIRQFPLVSGSFAYLLSIGLTLIKKKGADLKVDYGDGFTHQGKLLLISVANGCFCGGGIKGLPRAKTDDGLMDVSLVHDVPRNTFIRLFPHYAKGTHLQLPRLKNILRYTQEKSLHITAGKDRFKLCVDGEVTEAESVDFQMAPQAIRFLVPKEK